MGANTPVVVTVEKLVQEQVTIYAVTTPEAECKAMRLPGVFRVVSSRYKKPSEE